MTSPVHLMRQVQFVCELTEGREALSAWTGETEYVVVRGLPDDPRSLLSASLWLDYSAYSGLQLFRFDDAEGAKAFLENGDRWGKAFKLTVKP